jgi:hypothetical protein
LLQIQAALEPPDCELSPQFEHAKLEVAPVTLEKVFAEQFRHTDEPVTVLYFPGTHRAHGPPFGPVAPVLQVQAVTRELPTPATHELFGQLRHVSELFAPSVPE